MKARARKQSKPRQQESRSVTRSSAKPLAASHPILRLQRKVGNQAALRMLGASAEGREVDSEAPATTGPAQGIEAPASVQTLQRQAESGDDPTAKTEGPSPRALMLLDMFTKNRAGFKRFSGSEFQREANGKDVSVESIPVKDGGIHWTFMFVIDNETGFMYVRQSQDGTEIVNYYQGVLAAPPQKKSEEKCAKKGFAPFSIHETKPTQTGNFNSELEQFLIMIVKEIEAKSSPPKEIRICVTLFNAPGASAPGASNGLETYGVNVKKFLEARLPTSIKIIEVQQVEPSTEYYLLTEVTPVY